MPWKSITCLPFTFLGPLLRPHTSLLTPPTDRRTVYKPTGWFNYMLYVIEFGMALVCVAATIASFRNIIVSWSTCEWLGGVRGVFGRLKLQQGRLHERPCSTARVSPGGRAGTHRIGAEAASCCNAWGDGRHAAMLIPCIDGSSLAC